MNKKYLSVCEALDEVQEDNMNELTLTDPTTAAYVRNNPKIHSAIERGTGANIATRQGVVPFKSGVPIVKSAPLAMNRTIAPLAKKAIRTFKI